MHVMFTHILHSGKDEKLRPWFDSSIARERCRRQRPEGRGAQRRVILPPCLFRYPSFIFTSSATALLPDGASLIRPTKPAPSVESCNMPLPDGASLIWPTKPAPSVESCNMPGSASCQPVGRIRRSRHPARKPHRAENKKPCRSRVFIVNPALSAAGADNLVFTR